MELQKAQRKQAVIKMGLQGPSGSGKTYSALLLAYGLVKDWDKIAVIELGEPLSRPLRSPWRLQRSNHRSTILSSQVH